MVRWIDAGVGCSKVPDIHNVGLMEDRATLRISSQHMANWLHHGICSREQVHAGAAAHGQGRRPAERERPGLSTHERRTSTRSIAFAAACALVFEGREQPNGYTEGLLRTYRLSRKSTARR